MNQKVERVLLTGGSGFIGNAVIPRLLSAGVQIVAISSAPEQLSEKWGVQSVSLGGVLEGRNLESLKSFAPQAFLHLGWGSLPDYSANASLTNLSNSIDLIRVAILSGVGRVIVSGTCWEYGSEKGKLTESKVPQPTSIFPASKNALRQILEEVEKSEGVQMRWARLFYVYGPGQRNESLIPLSISAWSRGVPPKLRDTTSAIDLVHVEDVADGLVALTLGEGPGGIFNIGSGKASKVSEVVNMVREIVETGSSKANLEPDFGTSASWADIAEMKKNFNWSPRVELNSGITSMVSIYSR